MSFEEFFQSSFLLQEQLQPQLQLFEERFSHGQTATEPDPSASTSSSDSGIGRSHSTGGTSMPEGSPSRPAHLGTVGMFQTIPELAETPEGESNSPHSNSPRGAASEGSSDDFVLVSPGPGAVGGMTRARRVGRGGGPGASRAESDRDPRGMHHGQWNPKAQPSATHPADPRELAASVQSATQLGRTAAALMKLAQQEANCGAERGVGGDVQPRAFETMAMPATPTAKGRGPHTDAEETFLPNPSRAPSSRAVVALALYGRAMQLLHEAIVRLRHLKSRPVVGLSSSHGAGVDVGTTLQQLEACEVDARAGARSCAMQASSLLFPTTGASGDAQQGQHRAQLGPNVNVDAAVFQGTLRLIRSTAAEDALYDPDPESYHPGPSMAIPPQVAHRLRQQYESANVLLRYLWAAPSLSPRAQSVLEALSRQLQTRNSGS